MSNHIIILEFNYFILQETYKRIFNINEAVTCTFDVYSI